MIKPGLGQTGASPSSNDPGLRLHHFHSVLRQRNLQLHVSRVENMGQKRKRAFGGVENTPSILPVSN